MMIKEILKGLIISIAITSATSCTNVEDKGSTLAAQQSTSYVINNLNILGTKQLNSKQDLNLKKFLDGFQLLKIGTINKSDEIFRKLKSSSDKEAIELGEFGLLLLAYETDNMPDMKQQLQAIEALEDKSNWLVRELRNYQIFYNYYVLDIEKAEHLLGLLSDSEVLASPFLVNIKANLLIRQNKLEEAKAILEKQSIDTVDTINTMATLIYLTKGASKTVAYLQNKLNKYPDNELLILILSQYQLAIDKDRAIKNLYALGSKTQNMFILSNIVQILVQNFDIEDDIEKINQFTDKIQNSVNSTRYIDYYLLLLLFPLNTDEINNNLDMANTFNPMNYQLLWFKYYNSDMDNKLTYLHKIEKKDPYDNTILLELAKFYKDRSMDNELAEIKERFKESKRIKSEAEVDFMKNL